MKDEERFQPRRVTTAFFCYICYVTPHPEGCDRDILLVRFYPSPPLTPLSNAGVVHNSDGSFCLSVCMFIGLLPVKFARWQHMTVSGCLSCCSSELYFSHKTVAGFK